MIRRWFRKLFSKRQQQKSDELPPRWAEYPIRAGRKPDAFVLGIWVSWIVIPDCLEVKYYYYSCGSRPGKGPWPWPWPLREDGWYLCDPSFNFITETFVHDADWWNYFLNRKYCSQDFYMSPVIQEAFDVVGVKAEDWETWTDEQKAHLKLLLP